MSKTIPHAVGVVPIEPTPAPMPAAVNGEDAEVDGEVLRIVPKQFAIVDEKTANWLVRKIIEARQYDAQVKTWAAKECRRAEREEMTLMFLFGRQIEAWTKDQIGRLSGRRKSICLPAGTVGFRSQNAKLVIDDEFAVLNWARQNLPSAIQSTEKLLKSILNGHFETSGELPEKGAHVEPAREKFSISE